MPIFSKLLSHTCQALLSNNTNILKFAKARIRFLEKSIIIKAAYVFKSWEKNGGGHKNYPPVFIGNCVHVYACTYVCICTSHRGLGYINKILKEKIMSGEDRSIHQPACIGGKRPLRIGKTTYSSTAPCQRQQ